MAPKNNSKKKKKASEEKAESGRTPNAYLLFEQHPVFRIINVKYNNSDIGEPGIASIIMTNSPADEQIDTSKYRKWIDSIFDRKADYQDLLVELYSSNTINQVSFDGALPIKHKVLTNDRQILMISFKNLNIKTFFKS